MSEPLQAAVIGAQKCGTTALATFLGTHPQVATPTRKELHAFDDERHDWSAPDAEHLIGRHFAAHADRAVRLDATPITLYWPAAIERMTAMCPSIRTIVLLRDPVERAWSHWRMEVGRDRESLSFARCIREGRERVRDAPGGHHRVHSYVERGFYAAQLDRLLRHVPRERVLLVRQVDLLGDHVATLRRVHAFLGLAPQDPLPGPRRIHTSADDHDELPDPADIDHLQQLFAADRSRLASEHGVIV